MLSRAFANSSREKTPDLRVGFYTFCFKLCLMYIVPQTEEGGREREGGRKRRGTAACQSVSLCQKSNQQLERLASCSLLITALGSAQFFPLCGKSFRLQ